MNNTPLPAYKIKSPTLRAMALRQEREARIARMYEAQMARRNANTAPVLDTTTTTKQTDKRTAKATQLILGDKFIQDDRGNWYCQSQSDENKLYMVSPNKCTCPDHQYRQSICKHIRGYRLLVEKLDREAKEIKADLGW